LASLSVAALLGLLFAVISSAGPVGTSSGFEDDDGNLVDNSGVSGIDWNSFAPPDWQGTAPYRTTTATDTAGWDFTGLEDAQAITSDTAFAGGTKQNDDCATIIGQKADNKADLKRIYLASKTLTSGTKAGHVILNLAWVRIPQNTTSPSAHVAFEFNQNRTLCSGPNHDGLVPRSTANGGDLLVLYDFEGGNDTPVIRISRWVTPGTWSDPVTLTAGQAEAKVNTDSTVEDALAPDLAPNTTATLGIKEFGEAGIDLTDSGVFPATPTSCLTFGNAFGVSRTSGNSNTAQMKDIVGPGQVNLTNCGTVITRKQTLPDGDTTTSFGFTTNVATLPATTTSPFSLKDDGVKTITNVAPGSYFTTEGDPSPGYALTDINCSASNTATAPTETEATRTASFTIAAGETVDCTFTNTKQTGALLIKKESTKTGNPLVSTAGAVFSYDSSSVTDNGTGDEDDTTGQVCVSGLAPGGYTVNETSPPDGYGAASQTDLTATVVAGTNCDDNLPSGTAIVEFTNPPLSDIQVNFRDGGSGETTGTITCDNADGTTDSTPATDWDSTKTVTGVTPAKITCTIDIDP
jgi:hypothetical protein